VCAAASRSCAAAHSEPMRSGAALLIVVTACWREGPGPAPPPLRPEPIGPVAPVTPTKPRWRQSAAVAPKPPDPTRTPDQLAQQLSAELRSNGGQLMPSYVAGPVVVLDLDAGTLSVACDAAAVNGAQAWGMMFSDPARPSPHCRGSQSFTCSQFATQQILIVEFADPDQWRIVSVIVGNFRTGRSTMNSKIGQLRSQIATAACP